jgi:hypothetical protein
MALAFGPKNGKVFPSILMIVDFPKPGESAMSFPEGGNLGNRFRPVSFSLARAAIPRIW